MSNDLKITIRGEVYLPAARVAGEVGRTRSTLYNWACAGAVSCIRRGRGGSRLYISIRDARAITALTCKERLAQGIHLVPEEAREYARRWLRRMSDQTLPTAEHNGELWTGQDMDRLMEELDGQPALEQARILGRTYNAIVVERSRLRKAAA